MNITKEEILKMLVLPSLRCQLSTSDGSPLNEPNPNKTDWSISLPFRETFANAYHVMCNVSCNGFRRGSTNCYTYLKNVDDNDIKRVRHWLHVIGRYVVLRDCLSLSFALDFGFEGGDKKKPKSQVGALRYEAKTYYGAKPTQDTYDAANKLSQLCLGFLSDISCYDSVNCIVAVPSSDPSKTYNLPAYLADKIAIGKGIDNLSSAVRTIAPRQSIKDQQSIEEKFKVIEGTVEVDFGVFNNKVVLLVDDLYQSGVSMNYVAMKLLEEGATRVFGLACEKTARNDANVGR